MSLGSFICNHVQTLVKKSLSVLIVLSLIISPNISYAQNIFAQTPPVGALVQPTSTFTPVLMKGVTVNPQNPLAFDFIMDAGEEQDNYTEQELKALTEEHIRYFLTALAIDEEDMWVNLSPVEQDRVMEEPLAQTELGRTLLLQDYLLKQFSASLLHPDSEIGKAFWDRVYQRAMAEYGTTDVPVDTFHKVWIMPDEAEVYVHENTAYVTGSTMKVMLERDYLAEKGSTSNVIRQTSRHSEGAYATEESHRDPLLALRMTKDDQVDISSEIMREIIIPEITREVNEGAHFAPVRQVYNAMVLASWYRDNLKEAVLNKVYSGQNKVAGIDLNDPASRELVYDRYMESYRQGVFDFVKEDLIPGGTKNVIPRDTKNVIPGNIKNVIPAQAGISGDSHLRGNDGKIARHYFSGGAIFNITTAVTDVAMRVKNSLQPYLASAVVSALPYMSQAQVLPDFANEVIPAEAGISGDSHLRGNDSAIDEALIVSDAQRRLELTRQIDVARQGTGFVYSGKDVLRMAYLLFHDAEIYPRTMAGDEKPSLPQFLKNIDEAPKVLTLNLSFIEDFDKKEAETPEAYAARFLKTVISKIKLYPDMVDAWMDWLNTRYNDVYVFNEDFLRFLLDPKNDYVGKLDGRLTMLLDNFFKDGVVHYVTVSDRKGLTKHDGSPALREKNVQGLLSYLSAEERNASGYNGKLYNPEEQSIAFSPRNLEFSSTVSPLDSIYFVHPQSVLASNNRQVSKTYYLEKQDDIGEIDLESMAIGDSKKIQITIYSNGYSGQKQYFIDVLKYKNQATSNNVLYIVDSHDEFGNIIENHNIDEGDKLEVLVGEDFILRVYDNDDSTDYNYQLSIQNNTDLIMAYEVVSDNAMNVGKAVAELQAMRDGYSQHQQVLNAVAHQLGTPINLDEELQQRYATMIQLMPSDVLHFDEENINNKTVIDGDALKKRYDVSIKDLDNLPPKLDALWRDLSTMPVESIDGLNERGRVFLKDLVGLHRNLKERRIDDLFSIKLYRAFLKHVAFDKFRGRPALDDQQARAAQDMKRLLNNDMGYIPNQQNSQFNLTSLSKIFPENYIEDMVIQLWLEDKRDYDKSKGYIDNYAEIYGKLYDAKGVYFFLRHLQFQRIFDATSDFNKQTQEVSKALKMIDVLLPLYHEFFDEKDYDTQVLKLIGGVLRNEEDVEVALGYIREIFRTKSLPTKDNSFTLENLEEMLVKGEVAFRDEAMMISHIDVRRQLMEQIDLYQTSADNPFVFSGKQVLRVADLFLAEMEYHLLDNEFVTNHEVDDGPDSVFRGEREFYDAVVKKFNNIVPFLDGLSLKKLIEALPIYENDQEKQLYDETSKKELQEARDRFITDVLQEFVNYIGQNHQNASKANHVMQTLNARYNDVYVLNENYLEFIYSLSNHKDIKSPIKENHKVMEFYNKHNLEQRPFLIASREAIDRNPNITKISEVVIGAEEDHLLGGKSHFQVTADSLFADYAMASDHSQLPQVSEEEFSRRFQPVLYREEVGDMPNIEEVVNGIFEHTFDAKEVIETVKSLEISDTMNRPISIDADVLEALTMPDDSDWLQKNSEEKASIVFTVNNRTFSFVNRGGFYHSLLVLQERDSQQVAPLLMELGVRGIFDSLESDSTAEDLINDDLNNDIANDNSMRTSPEGGIDFKRSSLEMDVQGAQIDIQVDEAMISQMLERGVNGVNVTVTGIQFIPSVFPLLGLAPRRDEQEYAAI